MDRRTVVCQNPTFFSVSMNRRMMALRKIDRPMCETHSLDR
ncbi:UNVERIFIED_ORG: hypothetical protein J2W74_001340 [Methylorubrum zatmanii]|nr:hypothetical protein MSPGM_00520 [Methylorubrum sp. GM97]